MLADPLVSRLAFSERFLDLVRPHVPGSPRPVRAILFDKSPEVNWLVPWHQDLSLAVRERCDVPGFGPWSLKDGLPHVQPPAAWLEAMLTIRLHLDDAGKENGALRVLPGSHRRGKLDGETIARLRESIAEECIDAAAGDVFLMRPLLLHASGRSSSGRRRRVLHIEYCGLDLPDGLEWNPDA
jgi:ectoine hydroxylase-related dioxygenase (phytanoyl-CoA dioxygenase family)